MGGGAGDGGRARGELTLERDSVRPALQGHGAWSAEVAANAGIEGRGVAGSTESFVNCADWHPHEDPLLRHGVQVAGDLRIFVRITLDDAKEFPLKPDDVCDDQPTVYSPKPTDVREDERGFTLAEALTTIAILGILIAIAVIIFLALLERWRVDTSTRQLVGDLRLAHSSATNELADWRVVLALDRGEQEEGPDYYLVRLSEPYDPGDARPTSSKRLPRTFPGNVKLTNIITPSGSLVDDPGANYWVSPWDAPPSPPTPQTRTLEFNTDGTMTFFRSPSGSACVTVDGNPRNRVISVSATSRVRVEFDTCAAG